MVLATFLQAFKNHKDAIIILGTIGTGLLVGGFSGGAAFISFNHPLRENEIRQEERQKLHEQNEAWKRTLWGPVINKHTTPVFVEKGKDR